VAAGVQPDIVNVHYATGYGLLARFAHIDAPMLLSVWGSDVYDSPPGKSPHASHGSIQLDLSYSDRIDKPLHGACHA